MDQKPYKEIGDLIFSEDYLTAKEVAALLKVGVNTIYQWVSRREIPFVKLPGNLTRFPKIKVSQWLAKRSGAGKGLGHGVYLEAA